MNNLFYIRKDLKMNLRELGDFVGTTHCTLSLVESEKRPFTKAHIDKLTLFFDITSDFLLGKSDSGIKVHKPESDEEFIFSKDEYEKVRMSIVVTYVDLTEDEKELFEFKRMDTPEDAAYKKIRRVLVGKVDDIDVKSSYVRKLNGYVAHMTNDELRKTIKFIDDYIFNS